MTENFLFPQVVAENEALRLAALQMVRLPSIAEQRQLRKEHHRIAIFQPFQRLTGKKMQVRRSDMQDVAIHAK